jgi:hypothetical protein
MFLQSFLGLSHRGVSKTGLITGIAGVEMDFSPTDVENLNGAHVNTNYLQKE